MPDTLILSAEDVRQVLHVHECITVMRDAFVALAEGRVTVPVRTTLPVNDRDERLLLMPAVMRSSSTGAESGSAAGSLTTGRSEAGPDAGGSAASGSNSGASNAGGSKTDGLNAGGAYSGSAKSGASYAGGSDAGGLTAGDSNAGAANAVGSHAGRADAGGSGASGASDTTVNEAHELANAWYGAKVLSVVPGNSAKGRDAHQGVIVLFDGESGSVVAMLEAGAVTAIRTAAVSAVATHALARADACCLALIGSGVQAASHLAAMAAVRPLKEVHVWSPDLARCAAFVKRATDEFGVNKETGQRIAIHAVARPRDAVAEADIICTVSGATTPVIESGWIRAGTHINAVGAHRPGERELDSATIARARVFVDYLPSAMEEAGDILIPIGEGAIERSHVLGDLTSLVANRVPGRNDPKDVTIFKSVGLAIEDLAAAAHAYRRALATGIGTRVPLLPGPRDASK